MTAASFFRPQYGAAAVKGTVFDNPIWIGAWSLLWVVSRFLSGPRRIWVVKLILSGSG
jgi:hypothetical protein